MRAVHVGGGVDRTNTRVGGVGGGGVLGTESRGCRKLAGNWGGGGGGCGCGKVGGRRD